MSYGVPVIAYGEGGATETVVHGKTGLLFSEQTVESLVNTLVKFREMSWDVDSIVEQSGLFSEERFEKEFRDAIASVV
ncbi:glycosyltransferase [Candidatus Peribacteria bacterium]|nr:glycosyltransferase [Candidatus Peribacteria bacterium]